jgi:hypothetical protein
MIGKTGSMIYGPKTDGTYIIEFKTAAGALAISVPVGETRALKHFQARMPDGLVVPQTDTPPDDGGARPGAPR